MGEAEELAGCSRDDGAVTREVLEDALPERPAHPESAQRHHALKQHATTLVKSVAPLSIKYYCGFPPFFITIFGIIRLPERIK